MMIHDLSCGWHFVDKLIPCKQGVRLFILLRAQLARNLGNFSSVTASMYKYMDDHIYMVHTYIYIY